MRSKKFMQTCAADMLSTCPTVVIHCRLSCSFQSVVFPDLANFLDVIADISLNTPGPQIFLTIPNILGG